ncbi:MAG: TetR/AcrR family transcriptional regulator [Saprospiraceae bacterium]|nr:TetR/AcrR family transcriptional regulator [Saprospiraceae bacterium]
MKKNDKKDKIIKIGYLLFNNNGYNGTSINEIIKKASIPKGSFYNLFENKEQFAIEVLNYHSNQIIKSLNKTLIDKSISPIERILKLYNSMICNYSETSKFPYEAFASKIGQEVGSEYRKIKVAANRVFLSIREVHIAQLEEAQINGELNPKENIKRLAEFIIFSWEGAIIRMKTSGNLKSLFIFQERLEKLLKQ